MSRVAAATHRRTIADGLAQSGDNFLLLRFIAASLVIYGHAPAITGGSSATDLFVWLGVGHYSGAIAVDLFFIISGFLVTGSFLRHPQLLDFLWARAIRILPAYAACLLLSALLLGALFSTLPPGEYYTHADTWDYVLRGLKLNTDLAWQLPGVFSGNPQTATVNGSIWTLPAEVRMYVWVALLGVIAVLCWRSLFNLMALGLLAVGLYAPEQLPLVPIPDYVRLAALFLCGACCYINRDRIPLRGSLLLALLLMAWVCRATPAYPWLFAAAEVAFVFWFAYDTPWRRFNRFGDYSYGLYLWGFPAQQVVAALAGGLSGHANALCGFLLALALAIGSWHLIEKPALAWKRWPARCRDWVVRRRKSASGDAGSARLRSAPG